MSQSDSMTFPKGLEPGNEENPLNFKFQGKQHPTACSKHPQPSFPSKHGVMSTAFTWKPGASSLPSAKIKPKNSISIYWRGEQPRQKQKGRRFPGSSRFSRRERGLSWSRFSSLISPGLKNKVSPGLGFGAFLSGFLSDLCSPFLSQAAFLGIDLGEGRARSRDSPNFDCIRSNLIL